MLDQGGEGDKTRRDVTGTFREWLPVLAESIHSSEAIRTRPLFLSCSHLLEFLMSAYT